MTYTRAEIKEAIEKTANQIENDPDSLNHRHGVVSDARFTGSACALAWIGHFLDMPSDTSHYAVEETVFSRGVFSFYETVARHGNAPRDNYIPVLTDPTRLPAALRSFAQEYAE